MIVRSRNRRFALTTLIGGIVICWLWWESRRPIDQRLVGDWKDQTGEGFALHASGFGTVSYTVNGFTSRHRIAWWVRDGTLFVDNAPASGDLKSDLWNWSGRLIGRFHPRLFTVLDANSDSVRLQHSSGEVRRWTRLE